MSPVTTALSATQVLNLALRAARDFTSYDYRTLQADFARVEAELTPEFRAQYVSTTSSLGPLIVKNHAVSTVTSEKGGVTSFTGTTEVDLVSLDQHVSSLSSAGQTDRQTMTLTMQRQSDGRWLVSALRAGS